MMITHGHGLADKLLKQLASNEYEALLKSIKSLENIDIRRLSSILQQNNVFEISKVEDIENFDSIREKKCEEWIKSEDISKKKLAVLEKIFGQDLTGAYEITDFKIIMTSVGAYYDQTKRRTNYREDWNRADIECQHVCTSYIRNDMIGTAPINNICYGFSEMAEGSLIMRRCWRYYIYNKRIFIKILWRRKILFARQFSKQHCAI